MLSHAQELSRRGQSAAEWDSDGMLVDREAGDLAFERGVMRHLLEASSEEGGALPYETPAQRLEYFRFLIDSGRVELLAHMESFILERAKKRNYPDFFEGAVFVPALPLRLGLAGAIAKSLRGVSREDVFVGAVLLIGKRVTVFWTVQQHDCADFCDGADSSEADSSEGTGGCRHSGTFAQAGYDLDWTIQFATMETSVRKCPFQGYEVPRTASEAEQADIVQRVRHVRGTRIVLPVVDVEDK